MRSIIRHVESILRSFHISCNRSEHSSVYSILEYLRTTSYNQRSLGLWPNVGIVRYGTRIRAFDSFFESQTFFDSLTLAPLLIDTAFSNLFCFNSNLLISNLNIQARPMHVMLTQNSKGFCQKVCALAKTRTASVEKMDMNELGWAACSHLSIYFYHTSALCIFHSPPPTSTPTPTPTSTPTSTPTPTPSEGWVYNIF